MLAPIKIYLFGSFAEGKNTSDSDFDFYIVVKDDVVDLASMATLAYKSIRNIKQRPVDILVGTETRFEQRKQFLSVEKKVFEKGILLYGQ